MQADGPYDLEQFVAAQDAGGTYDRATAELRAGRKATHWMWFVFPADRRRTLARSYRIATDHFRIARPSGQPNWHNFRNFPAHRN
jgi:uncharacterized protein (DUF1810 family)